MVTHEQIRREGIKSLSFKQPYAAMMLFGKMETRTWNTSYRGPVLICASKKSYNLQQVLEISWEFNYDTIRLNYDIYPEIFNHEGKAFAVGRLVNVRKMKESDETKAFVKFNPDLYVHIYEDVHLIKPFEWKGSLGYHDVSQEFINKIIYK